MADKCVLVYRCGTERPFSLNGAHPAVTEGVVTRTVCSDCLGGSDSCWVKNIIKVKNCSSYYVYELPRTYYRYFGNADAMTFFFYFLVRFYIRFGWGEPKKFSL